MRSLVLALVLVLVGVAARAARGQANVPRETQHDTRALEAPCLTSMCWCGRDQCSSFVPSAPSLDGSELGASVELVQTSGRTGDRPVDRTDLAVLRTHGLVNLRRRAELFVGVDVRLWAPSASDEPRWQRVLLGVRAHATPRLAGYARVQTGGGLAGAGRWEQVEAAAELRVGVARFGLSWRSALGGTYTRAATEAHRGEVLAQTSLAFRARRPDLRWNIGGWWSLDLHAPVIDRRAGPDAPWQSRMSIGLLVGLGGGVDLFAEEVFVGRSDPDDPRTMSLDPADAFSRIRWRVGFNRRFGTRRLPRRP